jgi:hypothetical protein
MNRSEQLRPRNAGRCTHHSAGMASERNGSDQSCQNGSGAYCTYFTKGETMNDLNECERCAAEVNVSETLCTDCTRSVPMFEQSTSFNSVLDMLIQAEEDTVYTTV